MTLEVFDYRRDVRNVLVTPQIRSRFMRLESGEAAEPHSHDLGHEVFLVLQGRAEFTIDGRTGEVGPGQMCVALVDELHSLRALGDDPMTMYLSVTPHIQPTHTMWTNDGQRRPRRFSPSEAYDVETDASSSLDALLHRLTVATDAVREASARALDTQERASRPLMEALARRDLDEASRGRDEVWDALFDIHRLSAELADAWNAAAPRLGRT